MNIEEKLSLREQLAMRFLEAILHRADGLNADYLTKASFDLVIWELPYHGREGLGRD